MVKRVREREKRGEERRSKNKKSKKNTPICKKITSLQVFDLWGCCLPAGKLVGEEKNFISGETRH